MLFGNRRDLIPAEVEGLCQSVSNEPLPNATMNEHVDAAAGGPRTRKVRLCVHSFGPNPVSALGLGQVQDSDLRLQVGARPQRRRVGRTSYNFAVRADRTRHRDQLVQSETLIINSLAVGTGRFAHSPEAGLYVQK